MLLRICHTTRFEYQTPAYDSHNEVRMRPLEGANQRCVEFDLDLTPDTSTFEYDDYYGNRVYGFSIHDPHPELIVSANSLVERMPAPQPPAIPMPFGEYLLEDHVRNRVEYDFLNASRHVPFSEPMRKFFWLAKPDPSEDVAAYANRSRRLHPRSVRVRAGNDQGAIDRRRNSQRRRRRMPGLRASYDRSATPRRHPRPLRLRLPGLRRESHGSRR